MTIKSIYETCREHELPTRTYLDKQREFLERLERDRQKRIKKRENNTRSTKTVSGEVS